MRKGCEFAPVLVREEEGGFYVVLDGHHRTAASRHCSFTHIPVIIQTRSVMRVRRRTVRPLIVAAPK
jgi:ParB-like chromosome segregation protein Spo0J